MTDHFRIRLVAVVRPVLAVAILAGLTGCGLFNPDSNGGDPPKPFQYPDLSTPQNVMLNLKYSWERKDSLRTRAIYDDQYQGVSTDPTGTVTFTKDQEVATVWGMGKSQNISTITFTLSAQSTWLRFQYPVDQANGWTTLQIPPGGWSIQVDDVVLGTQLANSSNFFEFKFVPTVDAASPTDTTWKIIRWTEVKN